jgi:uncharacterized protein YjiS (DUF1127 family)
MEGNMHTATFKTFSAARNFSAVSVLNWVAECARASKQRRVLASLSLGALDDIGVTEAQAVREAHKPFWA